MRDISKGGFELPWNVLVPIIVLVALLVLYLIFSETAGGSIGNSLRYLKEIFRFGG